MSTGLSWFSARIRFAILIDGKGLDGYMDSLYLLRSADFESAFQRALSLGRQQEKSYLNADRREVRWKLAAVISIDMLDDELIDGREVYSEPIEAQDKTLSLDHEFDPEQSRPIQTGV